MCKISLLVKANSKQNEYYCCNVIIVIYCSGPDRDMIYRVFENEDGNVPVARFIAVSNFYCVV